MSTIIDAARALLSVCDGAVDRDDHGFNGSDAPFVHSLFERTWLTERQLMALHKLLRKYTKQLATHGLNYDELVVPPAGPKTSTTGAPATPRTVLKVESNNAMPPGNYTGTIKDVSLNNEELRVTVTVNEPSKPVVVQYLKGVGNAVKPWEGDSLQFFKSGLTARSQQVQALKEIDAAFSGGKRFVVLEAPVGVGKSFIQGAVVSNLKSRGGRTHWICPQIILQDQLERDFPAPELEVLKGRSNYQCPLRPGSDCAHAPCSDKNKGILPECVVGGEDGERRRLAVTLGLTPDEQLCPYWKQLQKCNDNPVTLFNFKSFLFQQRIGRFGHRDLIVLDEAHNVETELMGFVSMELTEWALRIIDVQIDREITTKQQLVDWMRERDITRRISDRLEDCDEGAEDISGDLDKMEADALRDLQGKIENFLRFLDKTEWIIETETKPYRGEERKSIKARPLFVKDFAEDLLFRHADRILAVSATILSVDVWSRNLGIPKEQIVFVTVPTDFPVENRPIHLTYAGNFGRKFLEETKPKAVQTVKAILNRHHGQRGIIHTHSFDLARLLIDRIGSPRFLFQENFLNKDALLKEHARRTDSVIVAPAFHEGVDLKDDLSRFQVILKTPYPSMGDRIVKERMDRDASWYGLMTALKLVQSVGRSVRSKTDWCYTYILDSGFDGFLARNRAILPKWFLEALVKYAPKEVRRS